MNKQELINLYDESRNILLIFERFNKNISKFSDANINSLLAKEMIKKYANNCIADLFILNDFIMLLSEAETPEDLELLIGDD